MTTLTTNGIKISVRTVYQPEHSAPHRQQYIHAYQITIENLSNTTVQLLRRHWIILDSNGTKREVEGEGVRGEQPILTPGQTHRYHSWSPLLTDIGKMYGTFLMARQVDNRQFRVRIPEFKLIAPFKMN
ncbi:MAG: Co2+/Mg2+ efflux protein ApaG [Bacteroidota bacterium]